MPVLLYPYAALGSIADAFSGGWGHNDYRICEGAYT
jgi:hypothetical protein